MLQGSRKGALWLPKLHSITRKLLQVEKDSPPNKEKSTIKC